MRKLRVGQDDAVPTYSDDGPLVSVFTAAFEIGEGIGTAFRSLVAQTHANWEWVVVDDSIGGATFDHLAALVDLDQASGRLRVYRQHPHTGSIGANKAAAAGLCRGDILVELDHDDELLAEALEVVTATFLAHPDVDFVFSDWLDWIGAEQDDAEPGPGRFADGWGFGLGAYASEVVCGRRVPIGLAPPLTWQTIRHIVAAPNHVRAWRRAAYRRVGGHDPTLDVADDYELVVRTFLGATTARLPRPLYIQHHRRDEGNASRVRNWRIQQSVEVDAARYARQLDHRLTSLGCAPYDGRAEPLCDPHPLPAANATIDVVAEAADDIGVPLVSVVIPTYRRPEHLRAAIDCALGQTYRNIEVLVVGDGCPFVDDVVAPILDPRLRHANLTHNHDDQGASPRNFALKAMARGSLVAYLDDDNTWDDAHLEHLVDLLDDPLVSYAFSSFTIGERVVTCRRPIRYQIDTSALLHRRGLLDHYGYWRSAWEVGYAHDWELVSRWDGEPWAASLRPTLHYSTEMSGQGEAAINAIMQVADDEARRVGALSR
jgi:glycosyltransferase involved in cell wall biosynthesis